MRHANRRMTRRRMLRTTAGAALAAGCCPRAIFGAAAQEKLPPVRQITRGPKFHWFGYYDKLEFDPTCRYVLSMETDTDYKSVLQSPFQWRQTTTPGRPPAVSGP